MLSAHTGLSTPLFDAAVAARKADIAAQAQHLRMLDDCNADKAAVRQMLPITP